jgi:hypothetical protein
LRSRSRSPSLPPLPQLPPLSPAAQSPSRPPSEVPKPRRSTAPLGSFSGPLPLAPSEEPRSRLSTPPSTLAEPPSLLPISALLPEPVALALAPPDAIVVSSDAEHTLQPYRAPLRVAERRRARLTLASTAALGLVLAASAASAYVLLHPRLVAEAPAPSTPPSPSASSVAEPRRRAAAPPWVSPPVAAESPRPALAEVVPLAAAVPPAPTELVVSEREPSRRRLDAPRSSASSPIDSVSPRAAERARGVLRVHAAQASESSVDGDAAMLEPANDLPSAPVHETPEPVALEAERAAGPTAPHVADVAAVPQKTPRVPGPDQPVARPRTSARLAATPEVRELSVRGSLATSEVRRALDRIKPQLAACYAQAARAAGRNGFGELAFEVEIDERGRAHAPHARGGSLPGLGRCLERATSKLAARPPDTGTVRAAWKVAFEP